MIKSRLDLQYALEKILGAKHVYYQPPTSLQMTYPAIQYQREDIAKIYADSEPYSRSSSYQVILITKNPEDPTIQKLDDFPYSAFDRQYVEDNLYHLVYVIRTPLLYKV
jgi:hypothetical protein